MSRDLCPTGVKGTKQSHTWKSPRVLERCFLDSRCCLLPSIQCPIPGPLPLSPTPPSQQGHPTPILKLWASWDDFPNQEEDGDFEVRVDGVSCLSPTIPIPAASPLPGTEPANLTFQPGFPPGSLSDAAKGRPWQEFGRSFISVDLVALLQSRGSHGRGGGSG